MVKRVEWIVKDTANPDKVYKTVEEFFDVTNVDGTPTALIQQHIDIEKNVLSQNEYKYGKESRLSEDGKSFQHFKYFKSETAYLKWLEEAKKLAPIDKHLTYTLVAVSADI